MPRRKKHPRLPNGYGSIRYLGKNRKNPYAVHPPSDIDGNRPPAICYVDDWMKGFIVLTSYNAGSYTQGMESTIEIPAGGSLDELANRIMADYGRMKGEEPKETEKSFADVYKAFYAEKYKEGHKLSASSVLCTRAAYKNCKALHDRPFRDLRSDALQEVIDTCPLKRSSTEHILNLYRQMYEFADSRGLCDKRYDKFVKISKEEDDEHGVPFSNEELAILWENKNDPVIEMLLIMCYSGYRIMAYRTIETHLDKWYFKGGVKTRASIEREVPIHTAIQPLVSARIARIGCMLDVTPACFRGQMYEALDRLGMEKHTPHDCRHTFSKLCEDFEVRENDRKRMLGHAFLKDITNSIYGHRDLEDLRKEIEKIKVDL